jgi:hypothetical protein
MINPSRNNNYVPPVHSKPLLTDKQLKQLAAENYEAEVVRTICTVFGISIGPVIQASFAYTGEKKPTVMGLNDAAGSPFPCDIQLLMPNKGRSKPCTLVRLFNNPLGDKLLLEFMASVDESKRPMLMIGMHPLVKKHVAVTNLPIEPAYRCCQMMLEVSEAKARVGELPDEEAKFHIVTLSTLPLLLRAIRRQNLWVPDF